jgi:hypothetical protein
LCWRNKKKNKLNTGNFTAENTAVKHGQSQPIATQLIQKAPVKALSFTESKALIAQQKVEEPAIDLIRKTAITNYNHTTLERGESDENKTEPIKNTANGGILNTMKAETLREIALEKNTPDDSAARFTLENLQKNWAAFAKTVESPTLQLQLNEAIPKLKLTEKTIDLVVTSTLAKAQIDSEMTLIELLRRELAAPMLVFNIKVARAENTPTYTNTPQQSTQQFLTDPEKLRLMADENGLIRDFFRKFDLKIEIS